MKKLIPAMFALLLLLCSCNAKKSFLHQRYTHFKHKKPTTITEDRSYADKGSKATFIAPKSVAVASAAEQTEPATHTNVPYTKAVINRVILPVVTKGKEQLAGLVASNSKLPVTKLTTIKPLKFEQKQERRGLLWGVIDGILAIIVLAIFVALVVWLVLVLA